MRIVSARAALAALLLACVPAGSSPPPPIAKPALWKLSDADTTIYLFGTIHALPHGYQWRDGALDDAFHKADALVLETVLDRDPGKASALLLGMGMKPGLPPLIDRVPTGKRAALA